MRLFIAEKPSLARAIAGGLGVVENGSGIIRCQGETVVTWCFGHILEQFQPDEYNEKWKNWSADTLPIIPEEWQLKPVESAVSQLKIIEKLLMQASEVVHAGDPDREGQLLVDEVLDYLRWSGPTRRLLLNATDTASVTRALDDLRDNAAFQGIRDAALARSRGDWLVGMNASRAATIAAQAQGAEGVISVGRVQTPTLALVVRRDREILNFRAIPYYKVIALVAGVSFIWQPGEDVPGMDAERRLVDRAVAEAMAAKVQGQPGEVAVYQVKERAEEPPLPFSLSALQAEASRRFGFSAQDTLSMAQRLYERGFTTYPRTDCRYLPEAQFSDAGSVLSMLAGMGFQPAQGADATRRHKAWDDKKISAHHAIVPTGVQPSGLSAQEKALFELIALSFCRLFHPPHRFEEQSVMLEIASQPFKAMARRILEFGWKALENEEKEAEKTALALPSWSIGDSVTIENISISDHKTTPPKPFTEGTLIAAMAAIYLHVDDPAIKAKLKEASGLGTEAIRANILETLKKRCFLTVKGKTIISTRVGRGVIDSLPAQLSDPGLTATWEDVFSRIEAGEITLNQYVAAMVQRIPTIVSLVLSAPISKDILGDVYPCPECGNPLKWLKKKDGSGFFWACFNEEQHATKKAVFFDDSNGKPTKDKKNSRKMR